MVKKWVDCTTDEKLEAIKADIDELYKRISDGNRSQYELAESLTEVRRKLDLPQS